MITISELKSYKKIIGWGAGGTFKNCNKAWMNISYVIDSNEKLHNSLVDGCMCKPVSSLKEENVEECIVIIFSKYSDEIKEQLFKLNFGGLRVENYDMVIPDLLCSTYAPSYALFGEDAIVLGISQRYKVPVRHYIDIGANNPILGNASYLFYMRNATGYLIEPNVELCKNLETERPKDKVLNAGIAGNNNKDKECLYYCIHDFHTRSTFVKEKADIYIQQGYDVEEQTIKLLDLDTIMEMDNNDIQYISIDVEGMEYEIIEGYHFDRHNVAFWNIEKGDDRVKRIMLSNSYELAAETPSNWIFVKQGIIND